MSQRPRGLVVSRLDGEEAAHPGLPLWASAYGEEVDELDEEASLTVGALPHHADQLGEARDEALVPGAHQRPGGDVADARRLDHQDARPAVGEAAVPLQDLWGDEALLGAAPRHHRRHPGA